MKGPAASLINAFIQIVNDNPDADICLFLPTDEESEAKIAPSTQLKNMVFEPNASSCQTADRD